MRTLMLFAGVAALAVAMPALADDRGRGKGQSAESKGHDRAERGRGRGGDGDNALEARRERGETRRTERREERAERRDRARDRAERAIRDERRAVREARQDDRRAERRVRVDERRLVREDRRDWDRFVERRMAAADRFDDDLVRFREGRGRRLAIGPNGCPPGLARQNALCMPPGHFRKAQLIGQRLPLAQLGYNIPDRYRYRFMDNDRFFYRYGNDGTVYRFDRGTGLVSSVVPIYGSGLFLGEPMPLGYDVYNVPLAYRSFYPDNDDYLYRYYGNGIYRVDADTMLVDSMVELLTGGVGGLGGLGVGDPLPMGYDVYNMPMAYRDTYYDTGDSWYRYADGYVYQVDPETRLIEAVISLLV